MTQYIIYIKPNSNFNNNKLLKLLKQKYDKFIGIELNKEIFQTAEKRIKEWLKFLFNI